MKKFDQFVNESDKEVNPFRAYSDIKYPIIDIVKKELEKIEVGNEGTTVSTPSKEEKIENIGFKDDYKDENGYYTHIIICVRLFYGNGDFINKFNSMAELGEHLKKVEDTIKSLVNVQKIANYGDYFCYLVEIDDTLENLIKSKNGIDKFKL